MEMTMFVIDDFYIAPDMVRSFALSQSFDVKGNFPGARTKSFWTEDTKAAIEHFMPWAGRICNTYGAERGEGYCGAFQITTALDRTWIHSDPNNMWAGVLYLTPDAPHSGGTGLFRWKATGETKDTAGSNPYDGYDHTKWDRMDTIGNKYNRLIVYRGDLYHASLDYFGNNNDNGRLFQIFFFDTERRL